MFKPFEVKKDMHVARYNRRKALDQPQIETLDKLIEMQVSFVIMVTGVQLNYI